MALNQVWDKDGNLVSSVVVADVVPITTKLDQELTAAVSATDKITVLTKYLKLVLPVAASA